MGQAVGTAAAIASRDGLTPRGVYEKRLQELRQALAGDDCFLPWCAREVPALSRGASLTASEGDPEPLRNGVDRSVGEADNSWRAGALSSVTYELPSAADIEEARIVFDSDLDRPQRNMRHSYAKGDPPWRVPETLVKSFRIETQDASGVWATAHRADDSHQRLVQVPLKRSAKAVRLVPESTWGADVARVFAFDIR
jgi:hypothetical protein